MSFLPENNLIIALQKSAEAHPDKTVTMYNSRCREVGPRSYAEVVAAAKAAAARMKTLGVGPGDRVIVAIINSWDWYDAWLGAVYLGATPVSSSPGFSLGSASFQEEKLFGIAERLKARLLVCTDAFKKRAETAPEGLIVANAEDLATAEPAEIGDPYPTKPKDTAYLQLTSGSTGIPKAAQITHLGLQHNAWAFFQAANARRGAGADPIRTAVSWLPLFHDFGLILNMGSMLAGLNLYTFPPQGFLSRPSEWIKHLAAHPAVVTAGPNFSMEYAVERLSEEQRDALDLSGLYAYVTGAEMNRIETMRRFVEYFAPVGLDEAAMQPGYGMAEATLALTMESTGKGLRVAQSEPDDNGEVAEVMTCGSVVADTEVKIMKDGEEAPEGVIGHVYARNPGMFAGYLNQPEETAKAMDGDWLVTGDLGFMRGDELFVTGRTKDILIINGSNYMPHELENLAEAQSGGGGMTRAAAFSVAMEGKGEVAVLTIEIDRKAMPDDLGALGAQISGNVSRELGIPIEELIFVPRGAIPRTTSGKIQRGGLKQAYLDGTLERLEPAET